MSFPMIEMGRQCCRMSAAVDKTWFARNADSRYCSVDLFVFLPPTLERPIGQERTDDAAPVVAIVVCTGMQSKL